MRDYSGFPSYLRLSVEGKRRFNLLAHMVQETIGSEIRDCFVSEVIATDGSISYPNFVFFLREGVTECHDPMGTELFDLVPLRRQVSAVDVTWNEYLTGAVTPASRLTITVFFARLTKGVLTMQAAGEGCNELSRVLREHIIPSLVQPTAGP